MTAKRIIIALAAALPAAVLPIRRACAQAAAAVSAERAGRWPEALQDYQNVLQNLPYPPPALQDELLRERIINLVKRLTQPPAVPEEATLAMERGQTYVRVATGVNDFERAAREFAGAVRVAPWFPGAMLNLAIVQERLHQYNRGAANLRLFLLAAPNDPQAAAARSKMAELQVLAERAADSVPWQTTHEHDWKIEQRTIEGYTDVWLTNHSHGMSLMARCTRGTPGVYIFWGRPVGDNPVVSYRLGSGSEARETWNGATSRTASFFPADPLRFLRDLVTAGELDARVTTTDGHELHASFGTSGLDKALLPFRAACPSGDVALGAAASAPRANPYEESLFRAVQAAARPQGGELPQEVRYLAFGMEEEPLFQLVEAADTSRARMVFSVFQIRYRNSWIMVDAGMDRATLRQIWTQYPGMWRQAEADSVPLGLRGAALVVLTHEHFDHAAGAVLGPVAREIAPRIMITRSQLASLRSPPARFYVPLPPDSVPGYQVVSDTLVRAIAPGVVLIGAPGHTPGSQMVYVHTASGREILLVGDLVHQMAGLDRDRQRPQVFSQTLMEDREAIQQQIDWVRTLIANHNVIAVPCHDGAWLDALAARGVIAAGLDLRGP